MIARQYGLRASIKNITALGCVQLRSLTVDHKHADAVNILSVVQQKVASNDLPAIKTLKNKLQRQLDNRYAILFMEMRRCGTMDEELVKMIFYRQQGPRQYAAFATYLNFVLNGRGSFDEKKRKIYMLIKLQRSLFPGLAQKKGVLVPEAVHRWFWQNLPKSETFNHYYFLIQNEVLLSSEAGNLFLRRLLKGSEIDFQLATFQIFLHDPKNHKLFYDKFTKLYSFSQLHRITVTILARKDFRHIKIYFEALLARLEGYELQDINLSQEQRTVFFIKFTNTLLHYLKQTHNYDMFLRSFVMVISLVKTQDLETRLLHKPLLIAIQYLRGLNEHSHALELIAYAQVLSLKKSFKFKQSLIAEVVSTLRSFNDPTIILNYITTVFTNPKTMELINELGIWGLLHHNTISTLSDSQLKKDQASIAVQKSPLSTFLTASLLPNAVVMTELYRVTLQYLSLNTPTAQFKQIIIDLYHRYKETLKNKSDCFIFPDCGILNTLVYNLRYRMKEDRLAYMLVLDFFQSQTQINCAGSSPFGLILYHNYTLTHSEISKLLVIMDKHNIKLDFKVITGMIFYYIRSGQVEDAHSWFQKLTSAGFDIKHKPLIKYAVEHNWALPSNVDTSFLADDYQSADVSITEYSDTDELITGEMIQDEYDGTTDFANELLKTMGTCTQWKQ